MFTNLCLVLRLLLAGLFVPKFHFQLTKTSKREVREMVGHNTIWLQLSSVFWKSTFFQPMTARSFSVNFLVFFSACEGLLSSPFQKNRFFSFFHKTKLRSQLRFFFFFEGVSKLLKIFTFRKQLKWLEWSKVFDWLMREQLSITK